MSDTSTSSAPILYDFDPRNAPAEILQAIGLIAASSAQTESVMQQLIGGLLGIDLIQAVALGTHMSAPLKDHIARALAELGAPDVATLDRFDDLLDNVNAALARRNIAVHNALAMHPTDGKTYSYRETARGSLQISLQPITVEELQKDAALIYEAGMAVMAFMMAHGIKPRDRDRRLLRGPNRGAKAREARRRRREADGAL